MCVLGLGALSAACDCLPGPTPSGAPLHVARSITGHAAPDVVWTHVLHSAGRTGFAAGLKSSPKGHAKKQ